MKYYRLQDDINFKNRWYLGDVSGLSLKFKGENSLSFEDARIEVYEEGEPMDFTIVEGNGPPVVSKVLKEVLVQNCQGISFIPVTIISESNLNSEYFILVIEEEVDCVDESLSDYQKFEINDPVRPDKAGDYRAFFKLIVDESTLNDKQMFRLMKFNIAIIVNEELKEVLESGKYAGLHFALVS